MNNENINSKEDCSVFDENFNLFCLIPECEKIIKYGKEWDADRQRLKLYLYHKIMYISIRDDAIAKKVYLYMTYEGENIENNNNILFDNKDENTIDNNNKKDIKIVYDADKKINYTKNITLIENKPKNNYQLFKYKYSVKLNTSKNVIYENRTTFVSIIPITYENIMEYCDIDEPDKIYSWLEFVLKNQEFYVLLSNNYIQISFVFVSIKTLENKFADIVTLVKSNVLASVLNYKEIEFCLFDKIYECIYSFGIDFSKIDSNSIKIKQEVKGNIIKFIVTFINANNVNNMSLEIGLKLIENSLHSYSDYVNNKFYIYLDTDINYKSIIIKATNLPDLIIKKFTLETDSNKTIKESGIDITEELGKCNVLNNLTLNNQIDKATTDFNYADYINNEDTINNTNQTKSNISYKYLDIDDPLVTNLLLSLSFYDDGLNKIESNVENINNYITNNTSNNISILNNINDSSKLIDSFDEINNNTDNLGYTNNTTENKYNSKKESIFNNLSSEALSKLIKSNSEINEDLIKSLCKNKSISIKYNSSTISSNISFSKNKTTLSISKTNNNPIFNLSSCSKYEYNANNKELLHDLKNSKANSKEIKLNNDLVLTDEDLKHILDLNLNKSNNAELDSKIANLLTIRSEMIQFPNPLKCINISNYSIHDIGINIINECLSKINTLKELILKNNKLTSKCIQFLIPIIDSNKDLLELDLSDNKISDEFILDLGKSFSKTHKLIKFIICNNDLTLKGVSILAKELSKLKNISELQVSNNKLTAHNINNINCYKFIIY